MKLFYIIFFILSTQQLQATEKFSYKAYSTTTLYTQSIKLMDKKKYDAAEEKLTLCAQDERCTKKLIEMYSTDKYKKKNLEKAAQNYNILYTLNYKKALNNLANLYYKNNDIKNAKNYYKLSAESGVYESYFNLAKMYEIEKNQAQALHYYEIASQHDISEADYSLGLVYIYGWGVKKDFEKALKYMQKAQKLGYKKSNQPIQWLQKQLNSY